MKKSIKLFALLVASFLLLLSGCSSQSDQSPSAIPANTSEPKVGLNIGNLAPDFMITLDDGKAIRLSELQGQAIFLNFWATWCPPCKQEMPEIEKFSKEESKIRIIAINQKETPMEVRSFMKTEGYTFPVGYDAKGEISAVYNVTGVPTSYAIDSKGIIRYKKLGPLTYVQLKQWFSNLE